MFFKNIQIVIVLGLSFGFTQKVHYLDTNGYVSEFYLSVPYYHDQERKIKPIEMLEIDYIENEAHFNDSILDGQVIKSEDGAHNINSFLDDSSYAAVYLYTQLRAEKPTKAYFILSVTDGAKIYLNENLIAAHYGYNYYNEGKIISCDLKNGDNSVVVKTINKDWDWKIKLKILDKERGQIVLNKRKEEQEYIEFLNIRIRPEYDKYHNYSFKVGSFPRLVLDKPGLARKYLGGAYTTDVRWFNANTEEVFFPDTEGRYGFYAEIIGENGIKLKRGGTLFCSPNDWMTWNNRLTVSPEYFPVNNIPQEIWEEHIDAISGYMGHLTLESILLQEKSTLMLSFLDEMSKYKYKKDKKLTPLIHNGDYHAKIKQKILDVENSYPDLAFPKKILLKSNQLTLNQKSYAKENPEFIKNLNKICKDWITDKGSPFDMVLAQDGEILFHEAFGSDDYGVFTINTPTEIASITKLFTGILFAQFVDQNIIEIDDPVGKYLPDFPVKGPQALTMRHCFTHTSGLYGHGLFDGVHNPWLENTLFQIIKNDTVGTKYKYNGMGFDLAGKIMEVVTGKSIFRLFHEYLYEPLGMENTYHTWDLGYSVHSTAYDLSILAQMVLNKGTYGSKKYFSKETFEKILPKNLKDYFPNITYDNPWDKDRPMGIGTTIQEWKIKDEVTKTERYMLSENVIGHGSATSSVFRIDLENNIILTQTRRKGNTRFGQHFKKLYQHIDDYLVRKVR